MGGEVCLPLLFLRQGQLRLELRKKLLLAIFKDFDSVVGLQEGGNCCEYSACLRALKVLEDLGSYELSCALFEQGFVRGVKVALSLVNGVKLVVLERRTELLLAVILHSLEEILEEE